MIEFPASMVLHLRERAEQCRRMARIATWPAIAQELRAIADEYDEDADRLESAPRPARFHS